MLWCLMQSLAMFPRAEVLCWNFSAEMSFRRSKPLVTMTKKESTRIKERPLIFVDLEFTGLQWKHEVIQIGALVVSQPDFKVVKEWETKIQAEHWDQADPEALKIVGYTEERWKNAVALREALTTFNEIARDGVLVGFNV